VIKQDRRGIKPRTGPMLAFKNFESAAVTIGSVELLRNIHKNNSYLVDSRSTAKLRPRSGVPCSPLNTPSLPPLVCSGYLHHSLIGQKTSFIVGKNEDNG
jgi:hypothetical protein